MSLYTGPRCCRNLHVTKLYPTRPDVAQCANEIESRIVWGIWTFLYRVACKVQGLRNSRSFKAWQKCINTLWSSQHGSPSSSVRRISKLDALVVQLKVSAAALAVQAAHRQVH